MRQAVLTILPEAVENCTQAHVNAKVIESVAAKASTRGSSLICPKPAEVQGNTASWQVDDESLHVRESAVSCLPLLAERGHTAAVSALKRGP